MSRARCASVCVGIADYEHVSYRTQHQRLLYAVTDAVAFSAYLRTAFPDEGEGLHVVLKDREGALATLEAVVGSFSARPGLDLFVLYLAGHGEREGWFCLGDAKPGVASLDGVRLDQLLQTVSARQVLVVVDCCHAEALLSSMSFFKQLGDSEARLFVASSRADQLAWEALRLRRSVLSDALLRACSNRSPIQDSRGVVGVDSALFRWLRVQVPLLAADQKHGERQEPVTGGVARADIELPTVDVHSFGRSMTISDTLRQRLRQVLFKGVATALLGLAVVQLLVYHIVATSDGRIVIRPGLRFTEALVPGVLLSHIDTGFSASNIPSVDNASLQRLANGSLWGIRTHLSEHGVRDWFVELASRLDKDKRVRAEALAVGSGPFPLTDQTPPPIDEALFLALQSSRPVEGVAAAMYALPPWRSVGCPAGPFNTLDLTILLPSTDVFVRDLLWQALRGSPSSSGAATGFEALLSTAAFRAVGGKDDADLAQELEAWSVTVAMLRQRGLLRPADVGRLVELLETSCAVHAAVALNQLDPGKRLEAEGKLVGMLQLNDATAWSGVPSRRQEMAVQGLILLGKARSLSTASVAAVESAWLTDAPAINARPLLAELVVALAETQRLSHHAQAKLFEILDAHAIPEASNERDPSPAQRFRRLEWLGELDDFSAVTALQVLSRQSARLDRRQRDRLRLWIETRKDLSLVSLVHESIGFLLAAAPAGTAAVSDGLFDGLVARLSPQTYFPAPPTGYRGEMVISAGGDMAMLSIARIGTTRQLPEPLVERLARFAIGRGDLQPRQQLLDALAFQWYGVGRGLDQIAARMRKARGDHGLRELEVQVACTFIVASPGFGAQVAVTMLETWRAEREPETRMALAQVMARAQWPSDGHATACALRTAK